VTKTPTPTRRAVARCSASKLHSMVGKQPASDVQDLVIDAQQVQPLEHLLQRRKQLVQPARRGAARCAQTRRRPARHRRPARTAAAGFDPGAP